jgi:NDP-sugar pyrophosphorylase family protein
VTRDLAGVVFAAGLGTRLRPLTDALPKALCPVANVALVDHAIARVAPYVDAVAVNAHAHAGTLAAHVGDRAHVSYERERPLGTAGALGRLREWIDDRAVLATNADAWHDFTLDALVDGWDGERVRIVTVHDPPHGDFGPFRYAGSCLLPSPVVAATACGGRITNVARSTSSPSPARSSTAGRPPITCSPTCSRPVATA